VNRHLRSALLILSAAAVCGAAVWGGLWYRARAESPAALVARIPTSDALVIYLDFAAQRRSGVLSLLDKPNVAEEPEYRDFARSIDFDYRRDLNSVLLAAAPSGKFLLAQGRFNWDRLRAYVASQNGRCDGALCRMQGSAADRRISFFPIHDNLMALAVSSDDSAALRMSRADHGVEPEVPEAPAWISIPSSVLRSSEDLPEEARLFARSMSRADSVVLAFIPENGGFAAKLTIRCRDAQDASDLASQLTGATTLLRQMFLSRHHTPNPAELAGVLTSGTFRSDGARVYGSWPVERAFLDNLLGGPS